VGSDADAVSVVARNDVATARRHDRRQQSELRRRSQRGCPRGQI